MSDLIDPRPARYMQATIGGDMSLEPGDALPPLWHWLYFIDARPASELGRDGHPERGGFLPPVPLPRRMWAGGRFDFHAPLLIGSVVRKASTIKSVQSKTGRSGPLCFVTVRHEMFGPDDTLAVAEEHDIVYRADPDPLAPRPVAPAAPKDADWSEQITPTSTLLFRYSAVTFNGHRIHYDPDYARDVEGYDGLVFHGPLTATLLAGLALRHSHSPLKRYSFTALAPLAGLVPFCVEGKQNGSMTQLWARRVDGALAMEAIAEF